MFCGSTASASSSKGIDAEAGRAEVDKERIVQEIGKDIGLTFEQRFVSREPQYNEESLEWISSQKRKSYDSYDSEDHRCE